MPEIYVSTDIETDGPIPGPHSMLSFASAAYRADKTLVGTFSANLHTLPDAAGHPQDDGLVADAAGSVGGLRAATCRSRPTPCRPTSPGSRRCRERRSSSPIRPASISSSSTGI